MDTPEFHEAAERLLGLAGQKRTAYMCSEGLFWRCQHRLVSNYLLASRFVVQHILPDGELRPHTVTEGARVEGGEVSYPSPEEDRTLPLFE